MADEPVRTTGTLLHFVDGTLVHAGPHVHEKSHPLHTHSFFELALVTGEKASITASRDASNSRSAT